MREIIKSDELFPRIVGAKDCDLRLMECESSKADPLVIKHHYSHKVTTNRFASFLINDGLGVIQLGHGIRPRKKHTVSSLITPKNYCEFDRMWLHDDMPKFSESRVIGLLLFYVKHRWPEIKFIITYADESAGNSGTIYRATNAIEIDGGFVDFYILPSGERVHPVSMWHRHKTRAMPKMQEIYPGIVHVQNGKIFGYTNQPWINPEQLIGARQRKYLYILDRKIRRDFIRGRSSMPERRSNQTEDVSSTLAAR